MQHKDKLERMNWIRKNIDGQTYLFQEVSEKCRMCGESDKSSLKKLAQKEYKQKQYCKNCTLGTKFEELWLSW